MFELLTDTGLQATINQSILLWALVAARMAPIVQLVPYLGGKAVPQQVKLALTVMLTGLVYPVIWSSGAAAQLPEGALDLTVLLMKEAILGVTFGFVAALVFDAVRIAGQVVDNARGQTQATAMAPQIPERVSVTGDYLYQLNIVVFLSLGGHQVFIAALVNSFVAVPPQAFPPMGDHMGALAYGVARLATDHITLGVLLGFPVLATILMTDLCLALINKAAPQINVFFLGMPVKAMAGVAVVMLTIRMFVDRVMAEAYEGIYFLQNVMMSMAAGMGG